MSKGGFLNSQLSTLICFIDDLTVFEQLERFIEKQSYPMFP